MFTDRLCAACSEAAKTNSKIRWKKVQFTMSGTWHLYYKPAKGAARTACGIGVT
jgi:hypothetical protein